MNNIEPENIQEPKLSIVGPALEASKFYIEEDELRQMFSKIIVSSADSSKNNKVHQSFVEIVKQLSIDDAKHLVQINKDLINPILSISRKLKDGQGKNLIKSDLFLSDHLSNDNHNSISASLINLQRLGLIEIDRSSFYTHDDNYTKLMNCNFKKDLENINHVEIDVDRGLLKLTAFGINFCDICL